MSILRPANAALSGPKLPVSKEDWQAKRRAVDAVLDDIGGVVTRVGDETVGEMWSLYDGQDVLAEIKPAFAEHIRAHVHRAAALDPFHVSANTDPKGTGRSARKSRTRTCSSTSFARRITASSSAAPSSRPRPPTRTRPS